MSEKINLPDPLEVAKEHFGDVLDTVPAPVKQAMIETFERQAQVIRDVLAGFDMREEQQAINARLTGAGTVSRTSPKCSLAISSRSPPPTQT